MNTVRELGRRVKLRYPDKYGHLSNEEAGRQAKAEYPGDYDDFVDEVESSQALTHRAQTHLEAIESPFINDLIDYYKPSRGAFSSWWQGAKSESRSKLLTSLNNEQRLVIEQWNIFEDSVREGKKTEADFRVFIADKAYQLLSIKHQATLIEQAMTSGLSLEMDQDVKRTKILSDVAVDEHERRTKINLAARWDEIQQDLNAIDRLELSGLHLLDKERNYLEEQIRKRHALQRSSESPQLKSELLPIYDEHIDFLKERINARQARLLSTDDGQKTERTAQESTHSRPDYPPEADTDSE